MSAPKASIEKLDSNLINQEIAPKIQLPGLARLVQTSKAVNTLFKKPLLDRKMEAIANYVEQANYEKLEIIAMADIELMFKSVKVKVPGVATPILISPLQYAFKTLDTYMWQLILKAIQHSQNQALLNRFSTELNKPITHIDLEPLFIAYAHYIKQIRQQVTGQQLDQDWLAVGVAQRECLSMGALRIFCDTKTDWKPETSFTADVNARPKGACLIKAFYDKKGGKEELLQVEHIGVSFSLINYDARNEIGGWQRPPCEEAAMFDFATLFHLFEVKRQDFNQLKAHPLNLTPPTSKSSATPLQQAIR